MTKFTTGERDTRTHQYNFKYCSPSRLIRHYTQIIGSVNDLLALLGQSSVAPSTQPVHSRPAMVLRRGGCRKPKMSSLRWRVSKTETNLDINLADEMKIPIPDPATRHMVRLTMYLRTHSTQYTPHRFSNSFQPIKQAPWRPFSSLMQQGVPPSTP